MKIRGIFLVCLTQARIVSSIEGWRESIQELGSEIGLKNGRKRKNRMTDAIPNQRIRKRLWLRLIALLFLAVVGIAGWQFASELIGGRLDRELIAAVKKGDANSVRSLLAQGANPNARDMTSRWYRMTAKWRGEPPVMLPYPSVLTVLVYALYDSDVAQAAPDIAKMLLDAGASTEQRYSEGDTALMAALPYANTQFIRLLLDHGANVNARNNLGVTVFMMAASNKDREMLELLASSGADINAQDNNGCTAFRHTLLYGVSKNTATLVALGADPNIRDNWGLSPLGAAYQTGDRYAIADLKKAGAKP
jgi:ankyrin repeat protein